MREVNCSALYQFFSSRGSLAMTLTFTFIAESTLFNIRMVLSSLTLYLIGKALPSGYFAETMMRFVLREWFTDITLSGISVISFSKPFLFEGSAFFCACASASAFVVALLIFGFGNFGFVAFRVLRVSLLNLSCTFFRNGMLL